MNKQIQELFEKSRRENNNFLTNDRIYINVKTDVEKFAELIIQECARVVNNADLGDVEGGDASVLYAASEQVKQHFGL